jgi:ABC-type transport system substrate-binding protein
MKMKGALALVLAGSLVLGLTAAYGAGKPQSSAASGSRASGGPVTVNIAMTATMGDLDPFAAPTQGRNFLRYAVYDNLAIFKEFGTPWDKMQWVIAKNIKQADAVTFDIEIYNYVKDAAGNQITSDDVIFCLNGMASSGKYTRFTNYMESAVKIDDYNLRIKLKTTIVGAIEYILAQCSIVDQGTYEANKSKFSTLPVTSGAYQVTECAQGSYYVLEKNQNYWQTDLSKRSYAANQQVDKFMYKVVTEQAQATISLQMGEDDIITVSSGAEIGNFMNDNGTPKEGYTINKVASTIPMVLSFNMEKGKMFDGKAELRKAILFALNQEDLILGGLKGQGILINDLGPVGCGDYNKAWDSEKPYAYNPEKTKEMLAAAGYAGGIDPATGKPLHLRLLVTDRYRDIAVILQGQLLAAGLDMEIRAFNESLIATYQFDPEQWDLFMFIQGTECYVTSVYDGIFAAGKDGKAPKSFVVDPKLQELISAAHEISTHNANTVEALHDYVYDNAYAIGLYQDYAFTVGKAGITLVNHPWGQLIGPACDYTAFTK